MEPIAIPSLLDVEERGILEERDRLLYHRHRARVRRQAEALVKEQAEVLALDLPLPR